MSRTHFCSLRLQTPCTPFFIGRFAVASLRGVAILGPPQQLYAKAAQSQEPLAQVVIPPGSWTLLYYFFVADIEWASQRGRLLNILVTGRSCDSSDLEALMKRAGDVHPQVGESRHPQPSGLSWLLCGPGSQASRTSLICPPLRYLGIEGGWCPQSEAPG